MTPTTVPISVTPEADAYIDQLGMRREFEQMLEHTLRTVPGLLSVKVVLEDRYELDPTPGITIEATMKDRGLAYDPTRREWGRWKRAMFPPQVCDIFVLFTYPMRNQSDAG